MASGYCAKHNKEAEAALRLRRGTSTERGYDAVWRRLRLSILRSEPWCRRCLAKKPPVWTLATIVDHVIPLPFGPRLDRRNLQPLCDACHAEKTAEDAKKLPAS